MSYAVKGAPFRYRGAVNVEGCKTSKDCMIEAGLNWEVAKCKLVAEIPDGNGPGVPSFVDCPNAFGTYRTDHNIPLGVVKERYTPVQNMEAFNFFDDAIGRDKAVWQTAGFFGNGERIFVSAKLPNNIFVHGDPVDNYLVFTTSHDGSSGVKILFTPIRVLCQNTLNAAIRNTENYVSFRHTSSVHKNLDIAAEILGICKEKVNYLNEQYNEMYKIKATDKEAQEIFAKTILTPTEIEKIKFTGHTIEQIMTRDWRAINDSEISMKKVNVLSEINNYYFTGVGQREILGTMWGAYNAITGYYSNADNAMGSKRMDSLLYGDKSRKIETAGNLILV